MNGIITDIRDDGETALLHIDDMPVFSHDGAKLRRWLLNTFGTLESAEGAEVVYTLEMFSTCIRSIALA